MKLLLIGATGQLGSDLIKNNPGHEIVAPARSDLDLERPETIDGAGRNTRPDWVINTAAFHNVPVCEEQPERAFRVNCVAVRDLALACRAQDCRLMTFSTDYVFGGDQRTPYRETACPAPVQIYGISKLAGEHAALSVAPGHATLVRTCGLYGTRGSGSKGGNFVDNRVKDGQRGAPLDMACDQTVGPTSTDDLSRAVYALLAHPEVSSGIYHLTNEGECTWYEFTRAIYDICGLSAELRPADRQGRAGNLRRPLYSVLVNERARALGVTLPAWRDALTRYLKAKYGT
jgi:dTDP-4-dehydrorhamnose reductase